MSNLNFISTTLPDLYLIERKVHKDQRGKFFRIFCQEELSRFGIHKTLQQINFSQAQEKFTTKGIHFQYPPFAESKIITCTRGEYFDLAVDLRPKSPTYLQWFSAILSEDNNLSMYIPEGFGHGWQSLHDNSSLIYLHTQQYNPKYEDGINIMDSRLSISWPNPPINVSDRDQSLNMISDNFSGIMTD
jgi:dTDP-4-dehydrorhamnose 3,5-epimerase